MSKSVDLAKSTRDKCYGKLQTMCQSSQTMHPESKGGTQIDFKYLTMINPASSSWFEVVE